MTNHIDLDAEAFAVVASTQAGERMLKHLVRHLETPAYQPGSDPSAAVWDAGRRSASEHIKTMIQKGKNRE